MLTQCWYLYAIYYTLISVHALDLAERVTVTLFYTIVFRTALKA